MKARAVTKNSINAAEEAARRAAKAASQRIEAAKEKARANYDHVAARAREARNKIYNRLPERFRKAYEAPPRVPNTSVRPIDVTAFDAKQAVFLRWTKEKFLLNIPYHGFLNRSKAIDAFEEVFVPAWNNGELDVWHYHDGRRFTIPKGEKTDFSRYVKRRKEEEKARADAEERAKKRERERLEAAAEKRREEKKKRLENENAKCGELVVKLFQTLTMRRMSLMTRSQLDQMRLVFLQKQSLLRSQLILQSLLDLVDPPARRADLSHPMNPHHSTPILRYGSKVGMMVKVSLSTEG